MAESGAKLSIMNNMIIDVRYCSQPDREFLRLPTSVEQVARPFSTLVLACLRPPLPTAVL